MTSRVSTGSERLDEILNGGLLQYGINLIVGVPGSGKTILSQQVAFHNATAEHPALFLSSLTEPLDKILRFGESLRFFNPQAVLERRVIYEDLGAVLSEDGLEAVLAVIDRHLKEIRPGVLVIDSFRAFHSVASDPAEFRRFLYGLTRRLTASPTTTIWNAPYGRELAQEAAEFAVADGIISLDIKQVGEREMRVLQVLKLRGSSFLSGEHAYRITDGGISVFPRLASNHATPTYKLADARAATGIAALDALLADGGYWRGAATLVAGPPGIGKTLMGLHFLYHGARTGETGVLATFQENKTQLARIVAGFGWSIDEPKVVVMSRGMVDVNIDEWVYELLDLVREKGATRVVIDSVPDLRNAAGDATRFREWMFALTQRMTRAGISLMMLVEVPDLFQLRRISEEGISHLADNVVLLQYVQEGPALARALTILKTRAMKHGPVVHRYEITEQGFELGEVLTVAR